MTSEVDCHGYDEGGNCVFVRKALGPNKVFIIMAGSVLCELVTESEETVEQRL
jgi:hypothetical protein